MKNFIRVLIVSFFPFTAMAGPCQMLQTQLQTILPTHVALNVTASTNTLCTLQAQGTGQSFERNRGNFGVWKNRLITFFQKQGWQQVPLYAADAPFSTQFAMQNTSQLAKVNFSVTGDTRNCGRGEPTDLYRNCNLSPITRNYVLVVSLLKKPNS